MWRHGPKWKHRLTVLHQRRLRRSVMLLGRILLADACLIRDVLCLVSMRVSGWLLLRLPPSPFKRSTQTGQRPHSARLNPPFASLRCPGVARAHASFPKTTLSSEPSIQPYLFVHAIASPGFLCTRAGGGSGPVDIVQSDFESNGSLLVSPEESWAHHLQKSKYVSRMNTLIWLCSWREGRNMGKIFRDPSKTKGVSL